ncbi:MAG: peptidoglycan DD-metalloendopeptidase family protein [Alphaproteobacteria bacterium]|nr:peptidoglycan DD-metalloendopeptidase family protein [Alphaproteobacteria bacterium]
MQIDRDLAKISKDMVVKARQIQNIEDQTSNMEKEVLKLQEELKTLQESFSAEDKNLIGTLYALQNLALKPTEALFVQPLEPVEVVRSAMLLRETVPFLADQANRIKKKLNEISEKKQSIEKQLVKIAANKTNLEKEPAQMRKLMSQKSDKNKQLKSQTQETQKKIKQLAEQAKDIKELLDKLEKERQAWLKMERERREQKQREQEELEAYRRENEGLQKTADTKSDDLIKFKAGAITETVTGFSKAKGHLSKPARGSIAVSYGEETSKGVMSKGISIATRPQAQVISPYDGAVIFAGPFRGYGNLIIIEHGEGYMSLLAGMASIDCEVGQMLLAGEPVGQMPNNSNDHLYVELRKDNKPIDPRAWIAN